VATAQRDAGTQAGERAPRATRLTLRPLVSPRGIEWGRVLWLFPSFLMDHQLQALPRP
jgi:hypothetical protein